MSAWGTYNSINGLNHDQRIVENLPKIRPFGLARCAEIIHQRRIKQAEFPPHALQILAHIIQTIFPKLPHKEPPRSMKLIHLRDKLSQEILTEMLHCIESNPLQLNLLAEPHTPMNNILRHLRVIVIQICEHEVVIIALLTIHIPRLRPTLRLVTQDFVDSGLVVVGVVIGTGEVVPVVFLLRVFFSSAGKVEAEPGIDFVGVGGGFVSVVWVDFLGFALFFVVCGGFVVQY
jgi:hypothetical protein